MFTGCGGLGGLLIRALATIPAALMAEAMIEVSTFIFTLPRDPCPKGLESPRRYWIGN
jgi:hypothetical protein